MRALPLLAALLILLLWSAIPTNVAADFQVNSTVRAYGPDVATGTDCGFVVVYSGSSVAVYEIFAQRYTSSGAANGTEFRVNTYTTDFQFFPAVAAGADGDFVVVWSSFAYLGPSLGVFGQRFDSSGVPAGTEFEVSSNTTGYQHPAVAADADGDFVVVWDRSGPDGDGYGIFGQRFDSSGATVGTEFPVNTYTTADQSFPAVAAGADGDFVVAWESLGQDGSSDGVFGQRYDSTGAPEGTEFRVNSFTTGNQQAPDVAAQGDGDFVVVWGDGDIFGQRFDSNGVPAGTQFQVNTYATYSQTNPAVDTDTGGNFVVVWQSGDGGPITLPEDPVLGQRYDSNATPTGTEFQVNTDTVPVNINAAVALADAGNFLVVWQHVALTGGLHSDVFGEFYAGGACPTAVPTATPTLTPTPTETPVGACSDTPDGTCTTGFAKGLLLVKEPGAGQEKLIAKLLKGPEILQTGFGNPLAGGGTAYHLCIYDDTPSLVADLVVDRAGDNTCSGGSASCWNPAGAAPPDPGGKGYKYKDYDFASSGVAQILLKGGSGSAGKSKVVVKGRGPSLPLPIAAELTSTGSVTLQLRANDAPAPSCFSVTLSDIKKQDANFFKAK